MIQPAPLPLRVLVRYGTIPEVAEFDAGDMREVDRGQVVVIDTHRGLQLGTVLDVVQPSTEPRAAHLPPDPDPITLRPVVRVATAADRRLAAERLRQINDEFDDWRKRIREWTLDLELIDIEMTLDGEKTILYVLNDRGPENTRLALQAVASGFGIIEVQPVSVDGVVPQQPTGGGCGSCGVH